MNDFKSVVKKLSSVFFCKLSRSHPAAYREMPHTYNKFGEFHKLGRPLVQENGILSSGVLTIGMGNIFPLQIVNSGMFIYPLIFDGFTPTG